MKLWKVNQRYSRLQAALVLTGLVIGVSLLASCSRESGQQDEMPAEDNIRTGEQIYFTATNSSGERIPYRGGPDFGGMMMGGYLTCAACHGPQAQGGRHQMHMWVMDAPAISFRALSEEEGEEHQEGGDDHGEASEYDLEAFRLAVVEGQHPDGTPLDENMPRWQMSAEDLDDLLEFLKTMP